MDTVIAVLDPLLIEHNDQTVPDSITSLVQEREVAKQSKDFTKADTLREAIKTQGYIVEDTPTGPRVQKHV